MILHLSAHRQIALTRFLSKQEIVQPSLIQLLAALLKGSKHCFVSFIYAYHSYIHTYVHDSYSYDKVKNAKKEKIKHSSLRNKGK